MLNKEPCHLKIDPNRGVLIKKPILNSADNKYIIRMDSYILDIIDPKIRNFITCQWRKSYDLWDVACTFSCRVIPYNAIVHVTIYILHLENWNFSYYVLYEDHQR